MTAPVPMRWDGEAAVPVNQRFAKVADAQFVVGEVYDFVIQEERSANSHKAYFAAIRDAWITLPEHFSDEYPSPESLRKKCLIKAGYCDERSIVCSSRAEALKIAAFIKPMDEYAIITVERNVIRHFTAKSQNYRSMDRKTFQESKDAVLDQIAKLLDVPVATLSENAGRAA